MGRFIRTLSVFYDTPISHNEIVYFRGAILKSLGDKANVLYHNHASGDTFRYSYPLIQYKQLRGKASIVCIDKGVDFIGEFLSVAPTKFVIGERETNSTITHIIPSRIMVQTWETMFDYHLSYWIPFNEKNYLSFKLIENDIAKIEFLEKILKGNLLSMLKGLDIFLEKELLLHITNLSKSHLLYNKKVGMTSFNVDFSCNLSIPNNVGIGKNASIGCGVIRQIKKKKEESKQ